MLLAGILAMAVVQAAPGSEKVPIVSVTGCLREMQPNTWMLTAATDPVPSSANAPSAKDVPTSLPGGPPAGKNEFRLIGGSEFNLAAHKGHTVIVKGLHIKPGDKGPGDGKAAPVGRLNVTAVTMVAASWAGGKEARISGSEDIMKRFVLLSGLALVAVMTVQPARPSAAVRGEAAPGAVNVPAAPTFTKDVAPIMYEKCTMCHRAGEVAPMTFMTYEDVRRWARVIKNKVVAREMPPWGADPEHSLRMRNDRSLSREQIDTIVRWVDAGAPRGTDAHLPAAPTFAEGWTAGREPDVILEMPVEFSIPAEGELGVQMFYSPVPFKEDRFAETLEIRPGNRSVVHHAGIFVVDIPEGSKIVDGRLI